MDFASSTCPICLSFFKQVTTIEGCCHQFCLHCITKKITEEGLCGCPVCNLDLGCAPLEKLRTNNICEKGEENINSDSEVSNYESSKELVMTHKDDDQAENPLALTLSKNKKQKYLAEGSKNPSTSIAVDDKNAKIDKKVDVFWFALVACNKQKSDAPLEQIPSKYLRVRDGTITVSSIKKYLVQKLNLSGEHEVKISMEGRQLRPKLQVHKLFDLWLRKKTTKKTKRAFVGCSAEEFVLTLTYGCKARR